jgi:RND family efflux transporter MFP subunit
MASRCAFATSWRTRPRRALSLLVGAGISCTTVFVPPQVAYAKTPAPQPVEATMAAPAMLETREIRAQLKPRRYTTLAAEIGAKVDRVPVPEGSRFKKGEMLVSFDCTLQRTQLRKAEVALGAAEKTWDANKQLHELGSAGTLDLELSEAEVAKARAEIASNKAVLAKCALVAPFSGRIAEQKVREQQYVQPGEPLLEILDDSELDLEFIVPSRWLAWLKPGHAFSVAIDETGRTYPARVRRIGARVDPLSQSIKLTATIHGRFNDLMAGMSGRVLMSPPGER